MVARGFTVMPPPLVAPVPVSVAVCVPAESVTVSVPLRVPLAVGLKVTEIVQLAPAARLVPHPLLATAKSPDAETEEIETAELVPLDSTTFCGELVVPTVWLAKVKLVGVNVTDPDEPVPPVPVSDAV